MLTAFSLLLVLLCCLCVNDCFLLCVRFFGVFFLCFFCVFFVCVFFHILLDVVVIVVSLFVVLHSPDLCYVVVVGISRCTMITVCVCCHGCVVVSYVLLYYICSSMLLYL